jgi:hypothetical protein
MARPVKRRRKIVKRVRREIRSLRRWATVFLALWGWFKLNEKSAGDGTAPGTPQRPAQP